jgi:hypothetical protein
MRFACSRADAHVETHSLRRPDLIVRTTTYAGLVVDERHLTGAFPLLVPGERTQVLICTDGSLVFHPPIEGGAAMASTCELTPGDAVRMPRRLTACGRYEGTTFVEIEWTEPDDGAGIVRLPRVALERARALSVALASPNDSRALIEEALALVRELGVRVPDAVARLEGGPSERDVRIALAMSEQLAELAHEGTALHLGEDEFNARYGLNSTNWRDTRKRWRVQLAAVLLTVPTLTVADVANEVGFGGAAALARAFATLGLPSPSDFRRRVLAEGEMEQKDQKIGR